MTTWPAMPDDVIGANHRLVREFVAASERRDTRHIVEAFSADGVYHATPLMGTFEIAHGHITAWRESFDLRAFTATS